MTAFISTSVTVVNGENKVTVNDNIDFSRVSQSSIIFIANNAPAIIDSGTAPDTPTSGISQLTLRSNWPDAGVTAQKALILVGMNALVDAIEKANDTGSILSGVVSSLADLFNTIDATYDVQISSNQTVTVPTYAYLVQQFQNGSYGAANFSGEVTLTDSGVSFTHEVDAGSTTYTIKAVNAGSTFKIQDQVGTDRLSINLASAAGTVTGDWTFNGVIGTNGAISANAAVLAKGTGTASSNYALYALDSASSNTHYLANDGSAYHKGNVGIRVSPQSFASQSVYGQGTTSATYSIAAYDSGGNTSFSVRDDKLVECFGNVTIGNDAVDSRLSVKSSNIYQIAATNPSGNSVYLGATTDTSPNLQVSNNGGGPIATFNNDTSVKIEGNTNIGTTQVGSTKCSIKGTAADSVLRLINSADVAFIASGVGTQTYTQTWNGANTALLVGEDSTTDRSISTGGTINASGADYAEYVRLAIWILLHNEAIKNNHNLTDEEKEAQLINIKKGEVIGFDITGRVTNKFSEVVSGFAVKSTKPNLVGGDTWSTTPRPEVIKPNDIEYTGSKKPVPPVPPMIVETPIIVHKPDEVLEPVPAEFQTSEQYAQAKSIYLNYLNQLAEYNNFLSDKARYEKYLELQNEYEELECLYNEDLELYETDLQVYQGLIDSEKQRVETINSNNLLLWNEINEQERATVDRIAFCGIVPIVFKIGEPGDHIIPIQTENDGIGVKAVKHSDLTFQEYALSVGRVNEVDSKGVRKITVKIG